jgi:hypothetical protein
MYHFDTGMKSPTKRTCGGALSKISRILKGPSFSAEDLAVSLA